LLDLPHSQLSRLSRRYDLIACRSRWATAQQQTARERDDAPSQRATDELIDFGKPISTRADCLLRSTEV
jgi:hypothetical protein